MGLMRRVLLAAGVFVGVALIGFWFVHSMNGVALCRQASLNSICRLLRRRIFGDNLSSIDQQRLMSARTLTSVKLAGGMIIRCLSRIHGAPNSPLLPSYSGDTINIHSPKKPQAPWLSASASFKVAFEELSPEQYAAFTTPGTLRSLPTGWKLIDVPFGHNTCAP